MSYSEGNPVLIKLKTLRQSVRLQGYEFAKARHRLTPYAYSVTTRGNICVFYSDKYNGKKYTHYLNDSEKEAFNSDGLKRYQMQTKEDAEKAKKEKEEKRMKKEQERKENHKQKHHQPFRAYYISRSTAYILDGLLIKWRHYSENPNDMENILHHKASTCEPITEEELDYILTYENVVIEQDGATELKNFTLPKYGEIGRCEK